MAVPVVFFCILLSYDRDEERQVTGVIYLQGDMEMVGHQRDGKYPYAVSLREDAEDCKECEIIADGVEQKRSVGGFLVAVDENSSDRFSFLHNQKSLAARWRADSFSILKHSQDMNKNWNLRYLWGSFYSPFCAGRCFCYIADNEVFAPSRCSVFPHRLSVKN